uniref:Male-enhanced antigen 1 n=1 Tax=Zosterops lateralis melanops TaxID=1220523 RepID=A0A8D2QRP4_ZOSLA
MISFQALVESEEVSPELPLLQAGHPQLSQPLLTAPTLRTPQQLLSPALDPLRPLWPPLPARMLRLHLPDPPVDSEEENEEAAAEGATAQSSRSSIPMDAEHVELVKRTMASVKLPTLGIPAWASQISEEQWKDVVQRTLQARQSLGGPRPQWN